MKGRRSRGDGRTERRQETEEGRDYERARTRATSLRNSVLSTSSHPQTAVSTLSSASQVSATGERRRVTQEGKVVLDQDRRHGVLEQQQRAASSGSKAASSKAHMVDARRAKAHTPRACLPRRPRSSLGGTRRSLRTV